MEDDEPTGGGEFEREIEALAWLVTFGGLDPLRFAVMPAGAERALIVKAIERAQLLWHEQAEEQAALLAQALAGKKGGAGGPQQQP